MRMSHLKLTVFMVLLAVVMVACTGGGGTSGDTGETGGGEEMAEFEPMTISADCEESGSALAEVAAVDQYTVRITLCGTDPAFLEKVAFAPFHIQSSDWLESTGGSGDLLEKPVGTGPYMVDSWNRGDSVVFTKFDDYWNDAAYADRAPTLVFKWNAEAAARLLELQAGTVDAIDNVGPDDFATVESDSDLQLQIRPALNVFYIAMTNTFEPFGDVRVRQAVAMGIDRQRIVDTFYPPGSEVASHFTPCSIANACNGDAWYDFDPEAARALLAEAGYENGFETSLFYRDVVRGYLPEVGRVAEDIQAQLAENLGINAEIVVMESGAFIDDSSNGRLDGFYLLGWGADYPHITNFLDFHFGSANPQFGDAHPEIYELLDQAATIADPAASAPLYTEANNAIRELVPMVPVAHGGSGMAYRADVQNAYASPLTSEWFAAMVPGDRDTLVFSQNAEPISMFCQDETDGESLRACEQVTEGLYSYEVGGTAPEPALATSCTPNDDLSVWTCTLRQGVTFHDGTTFDANDVVFTWSVGIDAANALHVGNTGVFEYWDYLWGLWNKPPSE